MMPTRWPSYILVILTAFLGWVVPYALPRLWRFIGATTKRPAETATLPAKTSSASAPISIRFHLAALLFPGFFALVLLTAPLLFSVHSEWGDRASVLIIGIMILTTIALFYCLRKGDLSWTVSRAREDVGEERRSE